MTGPNELGAFVGQVHRDTGLTWAEVGQFFGMSGEYARKLSEGRGKFGSAGAGRSFAANVERFRQTGAAQAPVQREQRVRQRGGAPSAPAVKRELPAVETTTYRGANGRMQWSSTVEFPRSGAKLAEAQLNDRIYRASQGHRHVSFVVNLRDGRRVVIGGKGGYNATTALRRIEGEGWDVIGWLSLQSTKYDFLTSEVLSVEVATL